jgi:hypothetical protein
MWHPASSTVRIASIKLPLFAPQAIAGSTAAGEHRFGDRAVDSMQRGG